MTETTRAEKPIVWPLIAWTGVVLLALVGFMQDWTLPVLGTELRPKKGHLLMEGWTVVKAALIGSFLGGWWWNAARWFRRTGAVGLLLWSVVGLAGGLSWGVFWLGCLILFLPALAGAFQSMGPRWGEMKSFMLIRHRWNGWFCVVWFLVWVTCDAVLLREAPPGWLATADALLARVLTHGVITCGLWFLLVWHDRWTPAPGRWLVWWVVMLTPLIVIVNTGLRVWWGKGMIEMFGELEVGGRFELERAWAAGGLELNAGTIAAAVGAVVLMAGLFGICAWLSRRSGLRMSPLRLGLMAATAWVLLQADQLAGAVLKERSWRWWERKAFHRRMTWVEPEPGLASFQVSFANPKAKLEAAKLSAQPDVFFFFVESLRADVVTPEITPFLAKWQREECQPLGETWAASNVTHQSWFSILSGRLPIFMEEARREKKLAPLPAVLKAGGYRVEVRMVNNFDYMDMVAGNFGHPLQVEVMEHVDAESSENFFKVPEREVRMLKRLKQSVASRKEGGLLAITGMDSTHYNYKWGTQFTPPFPDYEENPIFPMRPRPEEVRRIRNRFWNSAAWVDAQLADFVAWLKAQGRYEQALIIVTGDHGEEFKEQGSWFHGTMLNEPQTRVPILIKWPQNLGIGRGPVVARATHLDLMPTLMDALGAEPSSWQGLPGASLLHPPQGPRTIVMSTHFCGRNGEALLLNRDGVQAAFGWRDFWTPHVPETIWLERLEGAHLGNWKTAFPDVIDRVFERVEAK